MCYEYDESRTIPSESTDKPKRKNDEKTKNELEHLHRRRALIAGILLCCLVIGTGFLAIPRKLDTNYQAVVQTSSVQIQLHTSQLETYTTNQTIIIQGTQTANLNASGTQIAASLNTQTGQTSLIITSNCSFQWQYTQDIEASQTLQVALNQANFEVVDLEVSTFGELQSCRDIDGMTTQTQSLVMERNPLITLKIDASMLNNREKLGTEVGRLLTILDEQAIAYLKTVKITFEGTIPLTWKADYHDALNLWQNGTNGKYLLAFGVTE